MEEASRGKKISFLNFRKIFQVAFRELPVEPNFYSFANALTARVLIKRIREAEKITVVNLEPAELSKVKEAANTSIIELTAADF